MNVERDSNPLQVQLALNSRLSLDLNLVYINCVFKRNEIRLIILIMAMNKQAMQTFTGCAEDRVLFMAKK